MSTDSISNQTSKDVLSSSVARAATVSQASGRQNVAVQEGKPLPPAQQSSQEVSAEELQQVVAQLNDHVQQIQRDLQFSVDDSSGRTVIRVVDSQTEEVVRQIPSEEVLRISRNLQEQLEDVTGLIFETSA
jgi:flagellar protein FlaG